MVKMKLTDIYVWAGICLTGNVQELGMFHWVREMVEVVPLLMCTAVPLCSPHCAHLISAVCPCFLCAPAPYTSHVAVCPCSLYAPAPYTSHVAVCPCSLYAPTPCMPLFPILPYNSQFPKVHLKVWKSISWSQHHPSLRIPPPPPPLYTLTTCCLATWGTNRILTSTDSSSPEL